MTDTCPACDAPVTISAGPEGTHSYEPLAPGIRLTRWQICEVCGAHSWVADETPQAALDYGAVVAKELGLS